MHLKRNFAGQFSYIGESKAFHHGKISAEDVHLFLSYQMYNTLLIISDTMDFFVGLAVISKPSSYPSGWRSKPIKWAVNYHM